MLKTFYGNKKEELNFEAHKTKFHFNKIKKDNKGNIIYLEELNSTKLFNEKFFNEKKNKIDGYIYYGNNKIFKTKNSGLSSKNISNKFKTQNEFFKINNISRNLYNNKDNIIKNNLNSFPKFNKELSGINILNNIGKKDILYQKIKQNFNKDNSNLFPFIIKNVFNNDNNINTNYENNNNNIQIQNLNQLHKNFINSFKDKKGFINDNDKKILKKNYSQEWIRDKKIFSKIKEKKIKTKYIIYKNRNTNKIIKKSFSIENNINNDIIKKFFDNNNGDGKKTLKRNILSNYHSINIENGANKPQSGQKKISPIKDNYIFSNPIKNKNFSFRSSKNMKITEDNNTEINNVENLNTNNFKTSSFFFSPKFKKKYENNPPNIKEIINSAIANNIKLGQATMTSSFFNIGKNYFHNKATKTQKNFYSSSYNNNKNWDKEKEENNKESKFNKLKLILLDFKKWELHEKIWENIIKNLEGQNEIDILPPNNEDILISNYIKMFGKKNEIILIKENIINISINDNNIKNPRNEIKKWKRVYKNSILRWHPDKLFPLLTELKIKDENIIKDLHRSSTIIINNINNMYQIIMEILNKILSNKK